MSNLLYRGSVKDIHGPVKLKDGQDGLVFQYSDAYSVFDWGRMPDALERKGQALALLACHFFEKLEKPETWREFSKSQDAHALRKANRSGSAFVDLGEKLQNSGLRTHYVGAMPVGAESTASGGDSAPITSAVPLASLPVPTAQMLVRAVKVVKPVAARIMGKSLFDYSGVAQGGLPRLVPLEVVFRFSLPPGSSLIERARAQGVEYQPGHKFEFPYLELFTKLEPSDRPVTLAEALAICGLGAAQLEELLFKTAWVAGYLKSQFGALGLELADGKFEWALDARGELTLVDAIGPDELRILTPSGVQLSKEFLRTHYRASSWYEAVQDAKARAEREGVADWKRLCTVKPEPLPQKQLALARDLYLALANRVVPCAGGEWFKGVPSLEDVVRRLGE